MKCENCKFWKKTRYNYGECHRYAPRLIVAKQMNGYGVEQTDLIPDWCTTGDIDWCGEFQEKDNDSSGRNV